MEDLGFINGYQQNTLPKILLECKRKRDQDQGEPHAMARRRDGFVTTVTCKTCNYRYSVDSSG